MEIVEFWPDVVFICVIVTLIPLYTLLYRYVNYYEKMLTEHGGSVPDEVPLKTTKISVSGLKGKEKLLLSLSVGIGRASCRERV